MISVGGDGIDYGDATYLPSVDYFGVDRPVNSIADIGAHEYVAAADDYRPAAMMMGY